MQQTEKETGKLFHELWKKFTNKIFNQSLELIFKRYKVNRFDLKIIKNKVILDAGCGSGRHAVASAYLGAKKVVGIDISKEQVELNNKNFKNIKNIQFWNTTKTFDHEADFKSYLNEFKKLKLIFLNVKNNLPEKDISIKIINIYIQKINSILKQKTSIQKKRPIIIGEGNHRILMAK